MNEPSPPLLPIQLPIQKLLERVAKHPDQIYFHQPDNRAWRTLTWAQVDDQARRIASGLLALGCAPGDRVAILAKNCAEWFIADFAIAMAGLVSVPIYTTASVPTIEHILSHSAAKAIFIGKLDSTAAAEQAVAAELPRIAMPYPTLPAQHQWQNWLRSYEPIRQVADPAPDDTMTLVYTSGSTGLPKGVVLSFRNIAASGDCSATSFAMRPEDRCVSYLPLAHITERCAVEWTSVYGGNEIFFTESLDTFIDDVSHAQPTIFVSVPRLWTKFQSEILAKLPDTKLQPLLRIPLVKSLVSRKIRKGLGLNKCRLFGSGSAPISPSILQWYSRIGINICEGWGMTETSGLSCAAIPFEFELIGTIGRPVNCVEMKLSDIGEILIRGDAVFSAYYQNPEATREAFIDGWFHTGDLGEQLPNGAYKIVGRVKEQFKTGKGKYVSPAPIENLLGRNSDIEQVCVLGSGRKQPVAIVIISEHLHGARKGTQQRLAATLTEVNSELESHQRLDHIIVGEGAWTTDNHLLTPTLKIRRNKLEEKYAHLVHEEYADIVVWEADL